MRRSVVDEVFEAHEAYRLGQETSGFKSRTADRFQRRMGWGWVVPGFRERLVDFYDAVKRAPKPKRIFSKEAPDSLANNPRVVSAWKELAQYFREHEDQLLALYPRLYSEYSSHENRLPDKYVIPLKASKSDDVLDLERRNLLALSAQNNVGAWSGRRWANKLLQFWAHPYDPIPKQLERTPSWMVHWQQER